MKCLRTCTIGLTISLAASVAAADTIKIGFISTFSGPSAQAGDYAEKGVQLFLKENPAAFGAHQIEVIKRDDTGVNADVAKRLAQELIVQDKANLLMGFQFTPNAFAALPIATRANIP